MYSRMEEFPSIVSHKRLRDFVSEEKVDKKSSKQDDQPLPNNGDSLPFSPKQKNKYKRKYDSGFKGRYAEEIKDTNQYLFKIGICNFVVTNHGQKTK